MLKNTAMLIFAGSLFTLLPLGSIKAADEKDKVEESASIPKPPKKKKLYKWRDEHGNVHFTDVPKEGAVEFDMREVPTTKMEKVIIPQYNALEESSENDGVANGDAQSSYETIKITSPEKDGAIRNNGGTITLEGSLQPVLQNGHTVQFFLDGKPVGQRSTTLSVTLNEQIYGDHTAMFVVFNEDGLAIAESETVKFILLNRIIRNRPQVN